MFLSDYSCYRSTYGNSTRLVEKVRQNGGWTWVGIVKSITKSSEWWTCVGLTLRKLWIILENLAISQAHLKVVYKQL